MKFRYLGLLVALLSGACSDESQTEATGSGGTSGTPASSATTGGGSTTTTSSAGGGGMAADTTPPTVLLDGLVDGSRLRVARLVTAVQATDDVEVTRVGYALNGGDEIELTASAGATVNEVVDVTPHPGSNQLEVFAEDAAGNRGQATLNVEFGQVASAGALHTAVVRQGQLWVWGRNHQGQLGLGDTTERETPVHLTIPNPTSVELRQNHSLALTASGHVYAWGDNNDGQLGLGSTQVEDFEDRMAPVQVPAINDAVMVASGYDHTLVLLDDGTVVAFGQNAAGQLGDGSEIDKSYPVAVPGLTDVVQVIAGSKHSAALTRAGQVYAWGRNTYGNLGQGTQDGDAHSSPIVVPELSNVVLLASGRDHILALHDDGTVSSWGLNNNGQLGQGTSGSGSEALSPAPVVGLSGVAAVFADGNFSFALATDMTAVGWGQNFNGQLGIGNDDTTDRVQPDAPLAIVSITDIELGAIHGVGIQANGDVYTWGWNGFGSLGRESLINNWPYPTPGLVSFVP